HAIFIEVPPGTSRLDVDLFDADFGAGGSGEATANRDRARNGFDSSVTYSLRDPSGTPVATRFTTGTTTLPAGADNAWLTFYSSLDASISNETVRDEFDDISYNNNDGTQSWATPWIESNDTGGASGGDVLIESASGSRRLRVRNDDRSIQR